MRRLTVTDAALFCSLLLGCGIVMGIFGHIYVQNLTVKNRQKWGDELVSRINSKKKQPKPASITFHTDEIQ